MGLPTKASHMLSQHGKEGEKEGYRKHQIIYILFFTINVGIHWDKCSIELYIYCFSPSVWEYTEKRAALLSNYYTPGTSSETACTQTSFHINTHNIASLPPDTDAAKVLSVSSTQSCLLHITSAAGSTSRKRATCPYT